MLGLVISAIRGARSWDIAHITLAAVNVEYGFLNLTPSSRESISAVDRFLKFHVEPFLVTGLQDFCPVRLYSEIKERHVNDTKVKLASLKRVGDSAGRRIQYIQSAVKSAAQKGKHLTS